MAFNEILKHQRKKLNYSQQEIADITHIALRIYQRYEASPTAIYSARASNMLKICRILNINPLDFLMRPQKPIDRYFISFRNLRQEEIKDV